MEKVLANKTALVTGASRNLGKMIAKKLWQQGANLILVARSRQTLESMKQKFLENGALNQRITIFDVDLALTNEANRIQADYEGIDILVNNAAVQGPIGCAWENDWREWEETLQVNLFSPILLCRKCISYMQTKHYGKIINLSGGGATGPRPNFSAYAVAKVGLVRFSETLAQELKSYHIDVNCIAPGVMNSQLLSKVLQVGPEKAGKHEYDIALKQQATGQHMVERAADLCVYLASSKSDGITGKLISAAWDPWETLHEHREILENSDIYTLRRIVPKDRGETWGEVK